MAAAPRPDRDETSDPTVSTVGVRGMLASLEPSLLHAAPPPPERIREYKLLGRLGEGGMGAVYKAEHTRLRRLVAIKLLTPHRVQSPSAVARFDREMLAVGGLDHANIVRAFDAGEHEGRHFLVMEYVGGEDISELVRRHGQLPVADACEIIRQTALGLAHAHQAGLVHRDIKPSNLMLTESGTVKVLDLGLALFAQQGEVGSDLTTTGQVLGTVDYMAPEQGDDTHHVDLRSDIYSLGATLYKLLTGEVPFGGSRYDTNVKKLKALGSVDPVPVQTRRPEIPAGLAQLVSRLLARSPADRPATAAEVAEQLQPFCTGADLPRIAARLVESRREASSDATPASEPPPAMTPPPELKPPIEKLPASPERSPHPRWPRKRLFGGTAVGLMALLLGLVMYGLGKRTHERPAEAAAPFTATQARLHQEAWEMHLGVPLEFKNSIGMKFVLIPPGEFAMGSTPAENEEALLVDPAWRQLLASGVPQHKVVLTEPYYLGLHEVTQREYEAVMGGNPSYFHEGDDRASCPVEQVGWNDAVEFCVRLSKTEQRTPCYSRGSDNTWTLQAGSGYRLPSEAEWEFACRAGTTTKYSTGDNDSDVPLAAWTNVKSVNTTHPVGRLQSNPFGLYDMHGNVSEWCQDVWAPDYYLKFAEQPAVDPVGPAATLPDARRVVRGGNWNQGATHARSSCRDNCDPVAPIHVVGFRVALSIEAVHSTQD